METGRAMSNDSGATNDFVGKWLRDHLESEEVDSEMVALVKRCWRKGQVNEDSLLQGLKRMANKEEDEK